MPRFRLIAASVVAVLTFGGAASASAAPVPDWPLTNPSVTDLFHLASADCQGYLVPAGPKLRAKTGFRTECLGMIKGPDGEWGWCPDYGRPGPNRGLNGSGAFDWIKPKSVREQVQFTANARTEDLKDGTGKVIRPGALSSRRTAAAAKAAIVSPISADFRYDWQHSYAPYLAKVDAGVVPLAAEMLADDDAAGGVTVAPALTKKPMQGGPGTVKATVTGNGRPLAGVAVRWIVKGATITGSTAVTDARGTATLRLTWPGATALDVTPVVTSPEWRKGRYSTPSGRRQHLVRGTFRVETSGHLRYDAVLGLNVTVDCGPTCNGKPPIVVEAQAGATDTQWRFTDANDHGRVVKTLDFKAGTKGKQTFTGADGQSLQPAYRVRVSQGWSAWRTVGKPIAVICPPWPTVQLDCACDGTLAVTFTPPASKRFYAVTFGSQTKPLAGRTTLTAPLKTGESAGISVTAYSDAKRTKAIGTHTYGTWQQG